MRKTYISNSAEETEKIGAELARELLASDPDGLYFIMLRGPLGAGKTALTRGVASVLSPGSRVKSPTYTIVNEYRMGDVPLFHFDLYRLGEGADLAGVGFSDYVVSGHCILEWSEYLTEEVPPNAVTVTIGQKGEGAREISIDLPDE